MKILLIFEKNHLCTTGQYILRVLERKNEVYILSDKKDFRKIYEFEPHLILAIADGSHYILDINYHPKIILIIDSHTSFMCDIVMAKSFDIIFVAQKEYVEKFKKVNKNTYWLPLACDPEWHGKQNLEKIYDIAFIGQTGKDWRKKLLLNLKKDFPNSFISSTDCKDIGKIYSQAKIVFNYNVNNDINMKVFEALCSGSLLMTNKIKNNGFEELFEDKKHLVVYDGTYKDLRKKIEYYLKNENEREEIAVNGRKLVLEKHTYKNRVDFILEKISEIQSNKAYFRNHSNLYYKFLKSQLFFRFLFWKIIYLRIWILFKEIYAILFFK